MKELMQQIGIFLILGKTLLHFCPSEKYERYIKLLFGFMLVLQFATPILSLGNESVMEKYITNQEQFEREFEQSLKTVDEKWFRYNEEIEKRIENEQQKAEVMFQEQIAEQNAEETENDLEQKSENAAETMEQREHIGIEKVKIEVKGYE
ncbi:MAG: stage III sporulation protein AF [Lachnospiraceae bacterium]|nr:stage III sporulation protein AF [Lachnospiraceae bacterium]